ncbi:MAG: aldo/keto reductase [Armatimonadetes bacterium]|nr:aldo/keto reductase [Armatimonadota bacterium]
MEMRVLGRTGMPISVLGFGGAEIGFEQASVEQTARLLGSALDAGLNVIDTAECYGSGETASESLIGQAVSHRRSEFFLFTKGGHRAGLDHDDWTPELITAGIERSLTRLKTDYLDLVQLHSCGLSILQQGDVIAALQAAKAAGKTRFIGYSGENEAAEYAVSCGAFDTLQTSINLADQRGISRWVKSAAEVGLGIIAKRPIANACWKWPTEDECPAYSRPYWQRLQTLAYEDLSIERALRFTLTVPGVTTAIVGTKNPERWVGNAALAQKGPLPAADYEAIRTHWQAVAQDDWSGQV